MGRGWSRRTVALDQNARAEKMRSFAFQRLIATKFNEEMATQLPDQLTAHEFLDCGYGHDIGKYNHGNSNSRQDTGRHGLSFSPKKRELLIDQVCDYNLLTKRKKKIKKRSIHSEICISILQFSWYYTCLKSCTFCLLQTMD